MPTFLSIDIGTSSTKLSLFDEQGRLLASQSSAYSVDYPRPEWAEQDPELWWRAVCDLGPRIMAAVPGGSLTGISVSGMTPGCVPVDRQGRSLRPAILWLDRRAGSQARWLRDQIGEEACRRVSKNRIDPYFGGVKWLWLRQEAPEIYARTWKILQANSYIQLKLTGQAAIDPAQAGLCSPCFNPAEVDWDAEMCGGAGISRDLLPEVRPAWEVIGQVSVEAARRTGLPAGTPVVCGGGDFAAACLGAGAARPGSAAMMLGTAGNLLFPGALSSDPRLLHTIHLTGSRGDPQPLPFGGVLAGGSLAWFASLLGGESPEFYRQLDEAAAAVPPGSEGLIFLPYLMGERTPIWDPEARGAFIGLNSRHTRAHLYRAVLEGVAFAFRQIAELAGAAGTLQTATAGPLQTITAIDGGARSPLWRSILASTLGLPVRQGSQRSGTALGSAFLAALGAGAVSSFDAIDDWVEVSGETPPDPAAASRYNHLFPIFQGLYPKLMDDFHALGDPG